MASSSNLSNFICPISKRLWMCCASGSTYYNPGPHGQHGEPGLRSGQCDSSAFLLKHFVSDMCLIIMCLLVLMGLVKEMFYVKGLNRWCRVNNCTTCNEATVERRCSTERVGATGSLKGGTIIATALIDLKYPAVLETLYSPRKKRKKRKLSGLSSPMRSDVHL